VRSRFYLTQKARRLRARLRAATLLLHPRRTGWGATARVRNATELRAEKILALGDLARKGQATCCAARLGTLHANGSIARFEGAIASQRAEASRGPERRSLGFSRLPRSPEVGANTIG